MYTPGVIHGKYRSKHWCKLVFFFFSFLDRNISTFIRLCCLISQNMKDMVHSDLSETQNQNQIRKFIYPCGAISMGAQSVLEE